MSWDLSANCQFVFLVSRQERREQVEVGGGGTHWLHCLWSCGTAATCEARGVQRDVGGDLWPPEGL